MLLPCLPILPLLAQVGHHVSDRPPSPKDSELEQGPPIGGLRAKSSPQEVNVWPGTFGEFYLLAPLRDPDPF